jgi:SAM-dependent methyltransferase
MGKDYYTGESGKAYFQSRKSKSAKAQGESSKKFAPYVMPSDTVLDFGCGTGGIVCNIKCARRIGVEISEAAIKVAVENGVQVFKDISEVPDRIADVVISHHSLEHMQDPFDLLVRLSKKLKHKGRIIVVVPADQPLTRQNRRWHVNKARHLFGWTPLTLGNLLEATGYKIDDAYIWSSSYSHYIEWSRCIPPLFAMLKKIVSYTRSLRGTVCVAHLE